MDHQHDYIEDEGPFGVRSVCKQCGVDEATVIRFAAHPRLDLTHNAECGGLFAVYATIGKWRIFRCDECGEEAVVEPTLGQLRDAAIRKARQAAEWEARMRSWTPPQPMGRMPTQEEAALLAEYRAYSEDAWAAGFMSPEEGIVRRFIKWRKKGKEEEEVGRMWDYEEEFLAVYAKVAEEGEER